MAEDTLYNAMLLDFYGPLLTEKQREYFDLHYNSDYSLTEIAQESGVSRQAVWDNIIRIPPHPWSGSCAWLPNKEKQLHLHTSENA